MLNHIVPRKLLQGFENEPGSGTVWRFDKKTSEWSRKPLPINVLAAENDYYTDEAEKALADEVEGPANRYIDEIRNGSAVRPEAVGPLTDYMLCLISRGGKAKRTVNELRPKELEKLKREFETHPEAPTNPAQIRKIKKLLDEWKDSMPPEFEQRLNNPLRRKRDRELVLKMHLKVLQSQDQDMFTSDNPTIYTGAIGLMQPNEWIILPLAPRVALQWSWTGYPGSSGRVHQMAPARARSINRATVQWAERFIFARRPDRYVQKRHAKNTAHDAATGQSGRYTRTTAVPSTAPAPQTGARPGAQRLRTRMTRDNDDKRQPNRDNDPAMGH